MKDIIVRPESHRRRCRSAEGDVGVGSIVVSILDYRHVFVNERALITHQRCCNFYRRPPAERFRRGCPCTVYAPSWEVLSIRKRVRQCPAPDVRRVAFAHFLNRLAASVRSLSPERRLDHVGRPQVLPVRLRIPVGPPSTPSPPRSSRRRAPDPP